MTDVYYYYLNTISISEYYQKFLLLNSLFHLYRPQSENQN